MMRQSFVWILLVVSGAVWSGCEMSTDSSKTTYVAAPTTADTTATNDTAAAAATVTATANPAIFGVVVTQWPAYNAGEYFQHGNPDEGPYRDRINAACVAQGLNTLYIAQPPPGDELAMHLMWLKSPVDGHFMNSMENAYIRAKSVGVTRYVFDIGNADAATMERWKFLTKDYPGGTVQWVVGGHTYGALP